MKRNSLLVAVGLLPTLFACGGATFEYGGGDAAPADGGTDARPSPPPPPPADGGRSDASPVDGGMPWSPECPNAVPAIGAPCNNEGLECEYGDAWWNVACDVVVQCTSGAWASYQASFEPCSPKPGTNPAACPATYQDVPTGTECSATGTDCYYDQGMCACEVPLGGPILLDAGMQGSWSCNPGLGCPFPRARIGAACGQEGQTCIYADCDYGQMCMGGVWQAAEIGCAGAGAP